jgi:hypothetical protein
VDYQALANTIMKMILTFPASYKQIILFKFINIKTNTVAVSIWMNVTIKKMPEAQPSHLTDPPMYFQFSTLF